ncbi:UPF0481 protein At3g47200-like [Elaeis guineensis]|uniref:UPF0481 protein At3g02645 n=1 Tax=Elaeis guineensis var. tenera TaxID=51953 RepID=A0A6I9QHG2_ELAGV|nr:putative UPF0481 protein At3g02645 [Elaeis guineensis]
MVGNNSETAWIEDIQGNIRAATFWTPPWENQERAREESTTNPSIFRVPTSFLVQSPEHYQPKVVAIGPYHRGHSELLIKDEVKRGCVNYFISQHSLELQKWLLDMTSREQEARSYYSEDVSMDSRSFLEMLLLDGCFIFMAFKAMDSLTFDPKWPSDQIMLDLLMLENQIPFFVLVQLYNGIGGKQALRNFAGRFAEPYTGTFIHYALRSLDQTGMIGDLDPPILPEQVLHLLHLFRLSLCPTRFEPINVAKQNIIDFIFRTPTVVPSATELQDGSAVTFKKHSGSILDISFRNGVMKIPFLEINDGTQTILHNLIAFEQCYRLLIERHVTTYAAFMNCLINKESDASLLERSGILLNRLPTSKDATFFFSKLSPRAKIRSIYLKSLIDDVNRYHTSKWNRWYADLKLNYFSNPWVTISVVAAAVLLILSFMQTYYSALSYYQT